jgi:cytochrome c-type protein NapB
MKTIALLLLVALVAVAWVTANAGSSVPASIPDTSLGLSKTSVLDTPTPPVVKPNESAPGEQPALPRPYVIAPPRIPHGAGDFLPITLAQNACVDCHAVAEKKPGEATPLPPSHYTDLRNAPDRVGAEVTGARYVCTACHVPRTDAPDLVGNVSPR